MQKALYLISFVLITVLSACSETNEESTEFLNWKDRNDTYFQQIYDKATVAVKADSKQWKIIRTYSKVASVNEKPTENIVVEVLSEGTGDVAPLFTDSVAIHYRGHLIPSESYSAGYQFDSSWKGEYNLATMAPLKAMCGSFVDGFTTALLHMREGDRWRVYIPYDLGYGIVAKSGIPAYSTLIFDLTLQKTWHPKKP